MKKILLISLILISGLLNAQKNKFEKIYYDFEDQKGVTTISINKAMFSMLGNLKLDPELEKLDGVFKKMNSIKMIIIDDTNNNLSMKDKLKETFRDMNLEELMSINNEGNKIKFYTEDSSAESFKNLVLNINADNNLMYMILDGDITSKDLDAVINKAK